jgi:hypothetical protein
LTKNLNNLENKDLKRLNKSFTWILDERNLTETSISDLHESAYSREELHIWYCNGF